MQYSSSPASREAYTIPEFLEIYPISRTTLYRAWKEGRGPRRITIGRRVIITRKSGEEWIVGLEQTAEAV